MLNLSYIGCNKKLVFKVLIKSVYKVDIKSIYQFKLMAQGDHNIFIGGVSTNNIYIKLRFLFCVAVIGILFSFKLVL